MVTIARDIIIPWLLLVGLCMLIFWQSSSPVPSQTPSLPGLDKLVHAGVYGLLAFLAARAFATLPGLDTPRTLAWAAAIFAILYGLSDEVHQAFVPERTADFWDLVADAFGAVGGAVFYRWRVQGGVRR
jgi:VanZ family protein